MGKLKFPSDSITIGDMRRRDPEVMAGIHDMDAMAIDALVVCSLEQEYVNLVVIGDSQARPSQGGRLNEVVELLTEAYQEYGICRGATEGRELLRRLSSDARSCAERDR